MQATYLMQLGLLSVGYSSVLNTEDKLQFANKTAESLLYKLYLKLLKVTMTS